MCLIRLITLNVHLYLSGTWLGLATRTNIVRDMCLKEIGLRAHQNMVNVLGPIVNIIEGAYTTISCAQGSSL